MKHLKKIVWGCYFIAGAVILVNSVINKDYDKAILFGLLMSQSILILAVVDYYKD